jgi:ADP-heptose:LPS heptosyltransferase
MSALKKKWVFLKTYLASIKKLKNQEYDLCLIMRAYGNNLISFTKFIKCRYTIGHGTGGLGALLDEVVQWKEGVHEVEHYLEVLRPLGISAAIKDLHYELYLSRLAMEKIDGLWNKLFTEGEHVAIVHPGSGNPQKTLSIDQWRSCIIILENKGYHVVITGLAEEKPLAEKIASPKCTILCGIFDVIELACFFQKALLIVTIDALSAHLGAWSGTRTIAFYGGINDTRQWRPLGENVVVVDRFCDQAPCFNGCKEKTCMEFELSEAMFSDQTVKRK